MVTFTSYYICIIVVRVTTVNFNNYTQLLTGHRLEMPKEGHTPTMNVLIIIYATKRFNIQNYYIHTLQCVRRKLKTKNISFLSEKFCHT